MPLNGPPLGHLHIVLVEDSILDAELIQDMLTAGGIEADYVRVEDEEALVGCLLDKPVDVVLSDLSMPGFSGLRALELVTTKTPDVPFIFVSGTMGEEMAVRALHQGAADYILKNTPGRLPAAVARSVRQARTETEKRQVERELMRAQRLESVSLLAAGLSHDLRNILQPLLIVPDLIKARTDDPRIAQLADVIAECGQRGSDMTQSMLAFVRGSRHASETIEVGRLFEAVRLLLNGSLVRGIELHTEVADSTLGLEGNFTELQQVLLNLGLNAVQAMPDGGILHLMAEPVTDMDGGRRLCIRVADEGTGMSPEVMDKLFSPFFTTKADGTGLGLMSCKRIIESLGGAIQVTSQPGKGTRFDLLLPLAHDACATVEAPVRLPLGKGQKVLVVDSISTRLSLLGDALLGQ